MTMLRSRNRTRSLVEEKLVPSIVSSTRSARSFGIETVV
jgi:hypothetical protein